MYRDSSYIKTPKTSRRVQISIFNNFITNRYNALVYVFLLIDVLTLRFLHCNSFKFFSSTILQFFDNSKQINKLKRKLSIFQIFALLCGGGVGEQNVWCCENVEMIQDRLLCGSCGVKNNSTSGLWAECGACGAVQYDFSDT